MEEEIKIIEEMLNSKEPVCNYKLKYQEIEAISNLLTGYKELEEENKQLEAIRRYNFESILKSLVKEKIEELKGTEELLSDEQGYWGGSDLLAKIEVLQDLLERSREDEFKRFN